MFGVFYWDFSSTIVLVLDLSAKSQRDHYINIMMTPLQGIVAAQVHSQTITSSQFEQSTEHKTHRAKSVNAESLTFQRLTDVTQAILHHAFWLAEQKNQLSLRDYKKLLLEQGWQGEEKKYLKIAAAFEKFSPQDIAQVEPRTIYQLAENRQKYQPVINRLLDLSIITYYTIAFKKWVLLVIYDYIPI